MRLESALHTSRSGIDIFGRAISVVGDNVANSNTLGFKRSRTEFASLFPGGLEGDIAQDRLTPGSGAEVSVIRPILTAGIIEPTERSLDSAIIGRGFFIVGTSENPYFTRAGNFEVSPDGFLATTSGEQILGYPLEGEEIGPINLRNFLQPIEATTEVSLFGNLDSRLPQAEPPVAPQTIAEVKSAASFTAYQDVYDSLGDRHGVTLAFFKNAGSTWTVRAYIDAAKVGGQAGVPQQIGADTTLQFQPNGRIAQGGNTVLTANPAWSNGSAPGAFTINLAGFSQYATGSSLTSSTVNGSGPNEIEGYEIGKDGSVNVKFASGAIEAVGTLALATFNNEEGLARHKESLFSESFDSGERIIGRPETGVLGSIKGSAIERSNVDISTEFIDLTVLQRAYQANSQTLNATSNLIRDTIQLIR
jgi:flagellar hook protein FlgE